MIDIATVPVQGEDVILEISEDDFVNVWTLVCLIKQSFNFDRQTNKTNTQCGRLVGKGTYDLSLPFEGAMNVVEDALTNNAGYASYKKLQEWAKDFTALKVRQVSPTGDGQNFKNQMAGYLTKLNADLPVDNIMTFNGTFEGSGAWTTV